MTATSLKNAKRLSRRRRIRAKVFGTAEKPRLCVFKSNKYIYAQVIDDERGSTLASATGLGGAKTLSEQAQQVGKDIAQKALEKGIKEVVFDRSGYTYIGQVKTLAESAREGGLIF